MKVIITGATGMVGEGVLHECLQHTSVEQVLLISRRNIGFTHPRLRELILSDLGELQASAAHLTGYDACFFCLGISSIGKSEAEYTAVTYTLTLAMASTLLQQNPALTFCYVSGAGTDSSDKGKRMWARVKGKTENDLMRMPFKKVYAFRPGFMKPTNGLNHTHRMYIFFSWLYPLWRALFPGFVCTLAEVGLAMIHIADRGYPKPVLEVADIVELAKD